MKTTTVHLTVPSLIALVVVVNVTIFAILGALWETQDLWLPQAIRPWHHGVHKASAGILTVVSPSSIDSSASDADLRREYYELLLLTRSLSAQLAARDPASTDVSSENDPSRDVSSSSSTASPDLKARQFPRPGNPSNPANMPNTFAPLMNGLPSLAADIGNDVLGSGLFLGVGLGAGAAEGLNLSEINTIAASANRTVQNSGKQATGLNPAIQLAGQDAASTLLGALNVSSLFSGLDIGPSALALGSGIGNGTVMGLGLRSAALPAMDANASAGGIPEALGLFGLGLSSSVVGSINVTQLVASAGGGQSQILAMLPAAASGLGKGLGAGIPVGLGIQPAPVPDLGAAAAAMNGQVDAGMVAQTFAFGLTSSLLANGTVTKLGNAPPGMGLGLPAVDIGLAAQGLSRGLVQGAGDAVESIGGIDALLNGNARAPIGPMPNSVMAFNDSINGAAVGLGTGLGGQGVLVARQLLAGMSTAPVTTNPGVAGRDVQLVPRQAVPPSTPGTGFNLSTIINDQTVSMALQAGIDVLTCEGVGGLLGVLMGLRNSGAIPSESNENATALVKKIVPTGIIRFRSSGNSYEVDGQQVIGALGGDLTTALGGITINGRSGAAFVAFIVIHVLFALLIALFVLPLVMGLESARNILLRLRLPQILPNAERWCSILWFIVLAPTLVFVFVFGALLIGTTSHFRSVHGIFGFATTLVGYIAVLLHVVQVKYLSRPDIEFKSFLRHARIIRVVVNQLFLILSVVTSLLGFGSLSSVALCIPQVLPFAMTVSFGFGLAGLFVLGSTLSAFDIYLGWRYLRNRNRGGMEKGGQRSP